MTNLKIFLLGSPYIEYNGQPIKLQRRKSLALLAYLVITAQPVQRDFLATMLWTEQDASHARAGLRGILTDLNRTPLANWITSERHTISISTDDTLWVDVHQFNQKIRHQDPEVLLEAVNLYQGQFMAGFSLPDSVGFDEWQTFQTNTLHHQAMLALGQLVEHFHETRDYTQAIELCRRWIALDSLNETARANLMRLYALDGQRAAALKEYHLYEELLTEELDALPSDDITALYEAIKNDQPISFDKNKAIYANIPPLPNLVIGREDVLEAIRSRLTTTEEISGKPSNLIIQGWPGIGKTTLVTTLAYDEAIRRHFRDGILWVSLGEYPNVAALLGSWAQALGLRNLPENLPLSELSGQINSRLQDQRMLLIVDDVWEAEHAVHFKIGGRDCRILMTTRQNDVAMALSDHPQSIFKMPILTEENSVSLLQTLAPSVVETYPDQSRELIRDLEGLPLALQVAGRLLQSEMQLGWGITDLLVELREGVKLLEMQAPADRIDPDTQTIPTVAVLLRRSTDRLDDETQMRFAYLGAFAPKPATFETDAIRAVWQVDDPRPTIRILVDRGLLEPFAPGIFQMHALLVMHARSLFQE